MTEHIGSIIKDTPHTLKKFIKASSGTLGVGVADVVGSRGPSMTDEVGTASSSSNSLLQGKKRGKKIIQTVT